MRSLPANVLMVSSSRAASARWIVTNVRQSEHEQLARLTEDADDVGPGRAVEDQPVVPGVGCAAVAHGLEVRAQLLDRGAGEVVERQSVVPAQHVHVDALNRAGVDH